MPNTNKPRGTFVPAKAYLVTSPDCYKNILGRHNRYINDITVIVIEELHPKVLDKEIEVANKKCQLEII